MNEQDDNTVGALVVKEAAEPKLKKPNFYHVILNNDDFTPMDFVVQVLIKFFFLSLERATEIMLQVHFQGKAIGGTYPYGIAETKVAIVNNYARSFEYPLLCSMEIA